MALKIKMQVWNWHVTMGLQNKTRTMATRRWVLTFSSSIYSSNLVSLHLNNSSLSRLSLCHIFSLLIWFLFWVVICENWMFISLPDCNRHNWCLQECRGSQAVWRKNCPKPVINNKITASLDPEGWRSVWFLIFMFVFPKKQTLKS